MNTQSFTPAILALSAVSLIAFASTSIAQSVPGTFTASAVPYARIVHTNANPITELKTIIAVPSAPSILAGSQPYPSTVYGIALSSTTGEGQGVVGVIVRWGPGATSGLNSGYGTNVGFTMNSYAYKSSTKLAKVNSQILPVASGDQIDATIRYVPVNSSGYYQSVIKVVGTSNEYLLNLPTNYLPPMKNVIVKMAVWNIPTCDHIPSNMARFINLQLTSTAGPVVNPSFDTTYVMNGHCGYQRTISSNEIAIGR